MVLERNRSHRIRPDSKRDTLTKSVSAFRWICLKARADLDYLSPVDEEQVQRLEQQRIALDEQRTQLEAEIQRLSQAAKAGKPEQEKLAKLEVRCQQ